MILERPVSKRCVLEFNFFLKTMQQPDPSFTLAFDAARIGHEAAKLHRDVFSKIRPKSIIVEGYEATCWFHGFTQICFKLIRTNNSR